MNLHDYMTCVLQLMAIKPNRNSIITLFKATAFIQDSMQTQSRSSSSRGTPEETYTICDRTTTMGALLLSAGSVVT